MTPVDLAMCAYQLARITEAAEIHAAASRLLVDAPAPLPRPFLIVNNDRRRRS